MMGGIGRKGAQIMTRKLAFLVTAFAFVLAAHPAAAQQAAIVVDRRKRK